MKPAVKYSEEVVPPSDLEVNPGKVACRLPDDFIRVVRAWREQTPMGELSPERLAGASSWYIMLYATERGAGSAAEA